MEIVIIPNEARQFVTHLRAIFEVFDYQVVMQVTSLGLTIETSLALSAAKIKFTIDKGAFQIYQVSSSKQVTIDQKRIHAIFCKIDNSQLSCVKLNIRGSQLVISATIGHNEITCTIPISLADATLADPSSGSILVHPRVLSCSWKLKSLAMQHILKSQAFSNQIKFSTLDQEHGVLILLFDDNIQGIRGKLKLTVQEAWGKLDEGGVLFNVDLFKHLDCENFSEFTFSLDSFNVLKVSAQQKFLSLEFFCAPLIESAE